MAFAGWRMVAPVPLLVIGNAVWYNESWMTPTTIVRFDIETHQTQSWPVENCDDGMYLFYPDKNGFWFTCHGTDRLGKVEINEGSSAAENISWGREGRRLAVLQFVLLQIRSRNKGGAASGSPLY